MLGGSTAHRRWNSTWACPHTCWWCMEHWTEKLLWTDHVHHMTHLLETPPVRQPCSLTYWMQSPLLPQSMFTPWLTNSLTDLFGTPCLAPAGQLPAWSGGDSWRLRVLCFLLGFSAKMILLQTQDHKRRPVSATSFVSCPYKILLSVSFDHIISLLLWILGWIFNIWNRRRIMEECKY